MPIPHHDTDDADDQGGDGGPDGPLRVPLCGFFASFAGFFFFAKPKKCEPTFRLWKHHVFATYGFAAIPFEVCTPLHTS
jgi:hypothetical protein